MTALKKITAGAAAAVMAVSVMATTVSAGYYRTSNALTDYGYFYGTLQIDNLGSGSYAYKQGEAGTIMVSGTAPIIEATIEGRTTAGVELFTPYTMTGTNRDQIYSGFRSGNTQTTVVGTGIHKISNSFGGSWTTYSHTQG